MIPPTVGRVVWLIDTVISDQPIAAQIAYVNADGTINVGYLNHRGEHFGMVNVPLHQGEEPFADGPGTYAVWMPYQKGQAAKTEALEAAAKPNTGLMDYGARDNMPMERGEDLKLDPRVKPLVGMKVRVVEAFVPDQPEKTDEGVVVAVTADGRTVLVDVGDRASDRRELPFRPVGQFAPKGAFAEHPDAEPGHRTVT